MIFTVCLLLLLAAWVVALGRQAVPRSARVPLRAVSATGLGHDALRGIHELAGSAGRRPATVPVPGGPSAGGDERQPAAHL